MEFEFSFRNKPVKKPFGTWLGLALVAAAIVISIVVIIVSVLNLPLHFLLKLFNGRGLVVEGAPSWGINLTITPKWGMPYSYSVPVWLALAEAAAIVWWLS